MKKSLLLSVVNSASQIDRRIVYFCVALSLAIPLVLNVVMRPAQMSTADSFFQAVEKLQAQNGKIVLISADWGPGTQAENKPQTIVAIEHLMRRRIPFAITSIYALASPFLKELPLEVARKLEAEHPNETWEYGKDWINLGFRPGGLVTIQALSKTDDIVKVLKTDADNVPLENFVVMKNVKTAKDIIMLMEFTGLLGVFNTWLQYFPNTNFVHGCTSVTIPEAFIYYSSKQIVGLFEGVAGAAWYEVLLNETYSSRDKNQNTALRVNTGLSFAQILIIVLIVLGNIAQILKNYLEREHE